MKVMPFAKNPATIIAGYVLIVIMMFGVGSYFYVKTLKVQVATETARSFDASMVTIQNFYSSEIVPRAENAGITLSHNYQHQEKTIPFPATFTMDVGERFKDAIEGLNVSLFSTTPFPWRSERKLDQYQNEALNFLRSNPKEKFIRLEDKEGRPAIRYATAVTLKESCVACHNLPEFRFGQVWKVGDFRGVRDVTVPLPDTIVLSNEFYFISVSFVLITALMGGVIVFPAVRRLEFSHADKSAMAAELEVRNAQLLR